MNVGENLKRIRKDKGLTQEKLSELTKISITSIQRYELGKRQPTIQAVNKFAEALGVSINELFNSNYDKSKYELEEALLNGAGDIFRLVSTFENSAKEESVKSFRNLIEVLDWKAFKDINDDDIYDVVNSHELYNYLRFLFFEKLNKKI